MQCCKISVIKTNIQYNGIFHLPIFSSSYYIFLMLVYNMRTFFVYFLLCIVYMQQQSSLRVQQYFHIFTLHSGVGLATKKTRFAKEFNNSNCK